jgi:hypothetical protein
MKNPAEDVDRPRMICLDVTSVPVDLLLEEFSVDYFATLQKYTS